MPTGYSAVLYQLADTSIHWSSTSMSTTDGKTRLSRRSDRQLLTGVNEGRTRTKRRSDCLPDKTTMATLRRWPRGQFTGSDGAWMRTELGRGIAVTVTVAACQGERWSPDTCSCTEGCTYVCRLPVPTTNVLDCLCGYYYSNPSGNIALPSRPSPTLTENHHPPPFHGHVL